MLIGYMRPVHQDINDNQKSILQLHHCEQFYEENHDSDRGRIQLGQMMSQLTKDDKIVVTRLSILADSTRHLAELLEGIQEKGAHLQSIDENIDTSHTEKYAFIDIVKYIADFQKDIISEKTKKGMDQARTRGISTGRPKKPDENVRRAIELYESKQYSLKQIKEQTGISKTTLYRYLDRD